MAGHAKHYNHYNTMKDYVSNLTQGERLALAASPALISADSIGTDERLTVLSTPPNGFRMPSISKVREHDARLMAHGCAVNVQDDAGDDDEPSDDDTLRDHAYAKRTDSMREHSFRLPSQRSRRDVSDTLRSMGCTFHD